MLLMNKTLSKEIMKKKLNFAISFKERTDEIKKRYTSQQNYCVSPLKQKKKDYDNSLNENFGDNKTFWKTGKKFLSDKIVSKEEI